MPRVGNSRSNLRNIRRDYLEKISRVHRIYYDFDYRENFDLTLYLGEDYYAIPFLSNQ